MTAGSRKEMGIQSFVNLKLRFENGDFADLDRCEDATRVSRTHSNEDQHTAKSIPTVSSSLTPDFPIWSTHQSGMFVRTAWRDFVCCEGAVQLLGEPDHPQGA